MRELVPRAFLFHDAAHVGIFASIALAGHTCAVLATELVTPRTPRMVFTDPSYAETD